MPNHLSITDREHLRNEAKNDAAKSATKQSQIETPAESQMCFSVRAVHIGKLQKAFARMDAFAAKWPKDYRNRIGYNVEEVIALSREVVRYTPEVDELGNRKQERGCGGSPLSHFTDTAAISQIETIAEDEACEECAVVHPNGKCPENDRRAATALVILTQFAKNGGEWIAGETSLSPDLIEQNMSDLLCNFAHLLDLHGLNMATVLSRAEGHYDAETSNKGIQEFFPC